VRVNDYPHQFSGGMRQRVMIAMALSCNPDLLIADEPTTALDVTIQAQILALLKDLVEDSGTALIMITHDLGVVAGLVDRVNVLYAGRIVERGDRHPLFARPRHPYTNGLLGSIPRLDGARGEKLTPIPGSVSDNLPWTSACAFAPRCPNSIDICVRQTPELEPDGDGSRALRCFNPVEETP
jgi:peptide/nickel transport system ATP-binding protein